MRIPPALALALLLAARPHAAAATTWHIQPDGTGDLPTIGAAVTAAADGDTVELADGVFTGPGNRGVRFLGKAVTVRSAGGNADACTVDCESAARGFLFVNGEGPDSRLEHVSVVNAANDAIRIVLASPTIVGCVLDGFSTADAPLLLANGIYVSVGDPVIEACVIRAGAGHGVYVAGSTSTSLTDCVVTGNEAWGVFLVDASPDISGTLIAGNGAGIRADGSSSPHVVGGTISHNAVAALATGASASATLLRCILSFNGESVYCDGFAAPNLACCDLYGNVAGDWVGTCVANQAVLSANFSADPLFCAPADGDFTIRSSSPCAPPGVTGCGLVGALPVACGPIAVAPRSWGRVKGAYR